MGITKEEINNFKDPYYWVHYFPPLGKEDLIRFGAPIDWRR
jgi:leucyl-tRNA synthetase